MEFLQFLFCIFSRKLLPGLSESLDLNLISMRLDSGPRDEDTSWRSGKKIDHFTFFNTKCLV